MGNKSQNDYFLEEKDINKIKLAYINYKGENCFIEEKYNKLNLGLHSRFKTRLDILIKEKYLINIKEKLKLYDKDANDEIAKKMKEILIDCQCLEKKVFDDYLYYFDFFQNARVNYEKNRYINKEDYDKMCQDVIDSIINFLIKCEKDLFIIKDKIEQIKKFI